MFTNIKEIFKKTPIVKVILFVLILAIIVSNISKMLLYRDRETDNSSFQVINFYKEKNNDLDAVFVGSSCCFSFYSPLFAYNSYGIKTANYASSGMGMIAFRHVIDEIRKTQKNAPIIVSLTSQDDMNYTSLHYLVDYMPFSLNKLNLIYDYFTKGDDSILNSVEYFFPLMRFHERWSEIDKDDLIIDDGTKGATRHRYYLNDITDISEVYYTSDERIPMPEKWEKYIGNLLDYCDEHNEKISFLVPPRLYDEDEYKMISSLIDYVENRGYTVLDLREKSEEIGLNNAYDFYDSIHTNVHGSLKYTDYVINKIIDIYGLETGHKSESFDKAFKTYIDKISRNILEDELDMKQRDYSLAMPILNELVKEGSGVKLSWQEVGDADGYAVYRLIDNKWEKLTETSSLEYFDNTYDENARYTVFSYRIKDGNKYYGNYDYRGLSLKGGN